MSKAYFAYRSSISSGGRALNCNVGGRGFDPRGRTYTQVLKLTDKRHRDITREIHCDRHCVLLFSKRYV